MANKFGAIEDLLKNTGWSVDQLFENISNYKNVHKLDESEVRQQHSTNETVTVEEELEVSKTSSENIIIEINDVSIDENDLPTNEKVTVAEELEIHKETSSENETIETIDLSISETVAEKLEIYKETSSENEMIDENDLLTNGTVTDTEELEIHKETPSENETIKTIDLSINESVTVAEKLEIDMKTSSENEMIESIDLSIINTVAEELEIDNETSSEIDLLTNETVTAAEKLEIHKETSSENEMVETIELSVAEKLEIDRDISSENEMMETNSVDGDKNDEMNEEAVIQNLKEQIHLLRNKKKTSNPFVDVKEKLAVSTPVYQLKRKTFLPQRVEASKNIETDSGEISLSGDTDIVIANVVGGCELDINSGNSRKHDESIVDRLLNKFSSNLSKVEEPEKKLVKKYNSSIDITDYRRDMSAKIDENGTVKININPTFLSINKLSSDTETPLDQLCEIKQRKKRKSNKKLTSKNKRADTKVQKKKHIFQTVRRNCFVLFNGKKIWLTSRRLSNYPLAHIREKIKASDTVLIKDKTKTNPVNWSKVTNNHTENKKIHCRPGPLSKKDKLHSNSYRYFNVESKKLPVIELEVFPEIGKQIDPQIVHLLPKCDGSISESYVNYALATLISNKNELPNNESYKFPIPYQNKKKKILVRKVDDKLFTSTTKNNVPEKIISSILDDIIKYVEIKEINDSIIKNDVLNDEEKSVENKCVQLSELAVCSRKTKKSKIELELRRLNCTLVDVDSNNADNRKQCNKPYCKLGCLCDSLSCKSLIQDHCGKINCMFSCTCPKSTKSVPLLSSHLDKELTKNLAKVEKEFTQTVIHTSNDTIFVGSSLNSQSKRVCKIPKKYSDFLSVAENRNFNHVKPPIRNFNIKLKKLYVNLINLRLDDVIVYCMLHKIYNCSCITPTNIENTSFDEQPVKKSIIDTTQNIGMASHANETCARIREVFSKYTERNKGRNYNYKLKQKNNRFMRTLGINYDKTIIPSKRKQFHTIRTDIYSAPNFAMQRRKKQKLLSTSVPILSKNKSSNIELNFEGEVKVNLSEHVELLKFDGHTSDYVKLVPWKSFINDYLDGKINIWCRHKKSNVLFVNVITKEPPKDCINIVEANQSVDVIKWILKRSLPPCYNEDLVYLVLQSNLTDFEIRGMCVKNPTEFKKEVRKENMNESNANAEKNHCNDNSLQQNMEISPETSEIENNSLVDKITNSENTTEDDLVMIEDEMSTIKNHNVDQIIDANVEKSFMCKHRDYNNEMQIFTINKLKCEHNTLLTKDSSFSVIRLPTITTDFKWQFIYLQCEDDFLFFKDSNYTIQYRDLNFLVQATKYSQDTAAVTGKFCKRFSNPLFAIYCVSSHQNGFFIGPLKVDEEDKVVDINTVHLSQNPTKSILLRQARRTTACSKIVPNILPIHPKSEQVHRIKCAVKKFIKRQKTSSRRYVITNIANFGHFMAVQNSDTGSFEVFWPSDNKVLRFSNTTIAKNVIKSELTHYLQPMDKRFTLDVIIVSRLNPNNNMLINPKYLLKNFVYDMYGVYEVDFSPKDKKSSFLQKLIQSNKTENVIDIYDNETLKKKDALKSMEINLISEDPSVDIELVPDSKTNLNQKIDTNKLKIINSPVKRKFISVLKTKHNHSPPPNLIPIINKNNTIIMERKLQKISNIIIQDNIINLIQPNEESPSSVPTHG